MRHEHLFRTNIVILLVSKENKVFWGKRIKENSWQFPQGGVEHSEVPIMGMYRELKEEVGLMPCDVKVLDVSKRWSYYKIPSLLIKKNNPSFIGQKQKWFLLRLLSLDCVIDINSNSAEFDTWTWVNYWHPINNIIKFKQKVYLQSLKEFSHILK